MSYVLDNWSFDPFLIVVAVIVVANEVGLARLRATLGPRSGRVVGGCSSLLFYAGLGVLLVAVVSPIDYWASDYFFVHMVEHLLIAFFAPILIVAGAPWIPLLHALPVGARRSVGRFLLLGPWSRTLRRHRAVRRLALVRRALVQRGHGAVARARCSSTPPSRTSSSTSG